MNNWNKIIAILSAGCLFAACNTLDIPPKNILSGSDIYNEAGIQAYMSGMYNHIPMEDFKYVESEGGHGGFYYWYSSRTTLGNSGEFYNAEVGNSIKSGQAGYWSEGYQVIRNANVLIKDLPNYFGKLLGAEEWYAEARFIRAYTYYALVKRYGGVPLISEPQEMEDDLLVARSSHQKCVDFILEDLKYASENMSASKVRGRGNRFVAAAVLARVALYAGSIARYGGDFMYTGPESGELLCGIPASDADKYFRMAFEAAKLVETGGYKLETSKDDKRENCFQALNNINSTENVFLREYFYNNYRHSWNVLMAPERWTTTYGNRYHVPLDWVELFDGLPIDPDTGHLKTTDDAGNYVVYDSQGGIFDNAEPRLKASILIPGETVFKKWVTDLRAGVIIKDVSPDTPIQKTTKDDGVTTYSWDNGAKSFQVDGEPVVVRPNSNPKNGSPKGLLNGKDYTVTDNSADHRQFPVSGMDGPACQGSNVCLTGIYGAKWLDTKNDLPTAIMQDTHHWVDIRYAEVLLIRAEAAVELAQNGASDASELLDDAFTCINTIRDRAGANPLTSKDQLADTTPCENVHGSGQYSLVFAPTKGLQLVRVERYKELAVEHKLWWDLRRWFTGHLQMYQLRYRELASYMFESTAVVDPKTNQVSGKYIFDTRVCDSYGGQHNWDSKLYYEKIPDGQRSVNPLLEQNPRY